MLGVFLLGSANQKVRLGYVDATVFLCGHFIGQFLRAYAFEQAFRMKPLLKKKSIFARDETCRFESVGRWRSNIKSKLQSPTFGVNHGNLSVECDNLCFHNEISRIERLANISL